MADKFFGHNYGAVMVDFKEANKQVKLLKIDSYQKALLDFCFNSTDVTSTKIENPTSEHFQSNLRLLSNENDRSQLVYEYLDKHLRIEINQGNLLEQQVEVIVNAANVELAFGGKFVRDFVYQNLFLITNI